MIKVFIAGESITICQFLKKMHLVNSGGRAKSYLQANDILINGLPPKGKNTRVVVGSKVVVNNTVYQLYAAVS